MLNRSFVTIADAARRLRLSRHLIGRMVYSGELVSVTIAGRQWITEASLAATEASIARQTEPAGAYAAVA